MTIPLLMMKLSFLAPKTTFQRLFLGASLRRRFGLGPFGLSGGFHGPWMAMEGTPSDHPFRTMGLSIHQPFLGIALYL